MNGTIFTMPIPLSGLAHSPESRLIATACYVCESATCRGLMIVRSGIASSPPFDPSYPRGKVFTVRVPFKTPFS